jgi:hypothetical protein
MVPSSNLYCIKKTLSWGLLFYLQFCLDITHHSEVHKDDAMMEPVQKVKVN